MERAGKWPYAACVFRGISGPGRDRWQSGCPSYKQPAAASGNGPGRSAHPPGASWPSGWLPWSGMCAIPVTGKPLLSEPVAHRRLRQAVAAAPHAADRLLKAMFFIFRYLCCTRIGYPRMVEPWPDASVQALRCRDGWVRQGDEYGREAVLLCAQPTETECARPGHCPRHENRLMFGGCTFLGDTA